MRAERIQNSCKKMEQYYYCCLITACDGGRCCQVGSAVDKFPTRAKSHFPPRRELYLWTVDTSAVDRRPADAWTTRDAGTLVPSTNYTAAFL